MRNHLVVHFDVGQTFLLSLLLLVSIYFRLIFLLRTTGR